MKCPGYILLWRQFMDTSFYKDSPAFHLAVHLIFKANHADNDVIFNKNHLTIKRGQHLTGRHQLAKELGLPGGTIRNKLKLLQNIGFLDIKSTNKFSIITICNYDNYQNIKQRNGQHLGQREDSKRTARGQQEDTPNELIIHDNELIIHDNKENIYTEIVNYLNQVLETKYKPFANETKELINARLKKGFTIEDFKIVIDKKYAEWGNDSNMAKYLRPETLFGNKFEGYLNQPIVKPMTHNDRVIASFINRTKENDNDEERSNKTGVKTGSIIS